MIPHEGACPHPQRACVCDELLNRELNATKEQVQVRRRALRDVTIWRRKAEQDYKRALAAEREHYSRLLQALEARASVVGRQAERAVHEVLDQAGYDVVLAETGPNAPLDAARGGGPSGRETP